MEKVYYSIKEVSEIIDEKPYTIRYWEKLNPRLKAKKTKTGTKLYNKKQIDEFKILKTKKRNIDELRPSTNTEQEQPDNKTTYSDMLYQKFTALSVNQENEPLSPDSVVLVTKKELAQLVDVVKSIISYNNQ